jgi:hypothetical protein
VHGVVLGIPAPSAACLAGACPRFADNTLPKYTASTNDGLRFVLFNAEAIAIVPSCVAVKDFNEPLKAPMGVREYASMHTSSSFNTVVVGFIL